MVTLNDFILPLWRRVPVGIRQKVARSLLNIMATSLSDVEPLEVADRTLPRIIVGFLSSPSGLGQSARLLASALQQQGYAVFGIDLSGYFFEAARTVEHGLPDGRTVSGKAHLIVNVNAPYMPYVLWLLGRRFLQEKYVTGYWAWELPTLPENWRRGLACVHDIFVPSTFVASAVHGMERDKRVLVLPHPVAVECGGNDSACEEQGADATAQSFTVGFMANVASGFVRKNPLGVIAAFRRAFGNDGSCRLKMVLTNVDHYPAARMAVEEAAKGADNIEIIWHGMSRTALHHWWRDVDVYLSLHRSEGFGLPLAEAMCAGLPVVATGWSGNMDFMTEENSFPVKYELVDVLDRQGKYPSNCGQWAEPDINHAADLLQRVRENRELARRIGHRARKDIHVLLSARSVIGRYEKHLATVNSGKG